MSKIAARVEGIRSSLSAAETFVRRIDEIDARLLELRQEWRAVDLPLPKSDIAALTLEWLRSTAHAFGTQPPNWARNVAMDLVDSLSRQQQPSISNELFVWLLLPQLEASVPKAIAGLSYEAGAPLKERPQRKAAIEEERARLVAEREHAVDQVVTLSNGALQVEHLEETAQRRVREAREQAWLDGRKDRVGIDETRINERYERDRIRAR